MENVTRNYFETAVVGLDVHKKTITWALFLPGIQDAARSGVISNVTKAINGLIKRINEQASGSQIVWVYEAGCMGYHLHTHFTDKGEDCRVIDPGSIPKKVRGHKDDIRDAIAIGQHFRNGVLSEVMVPDEELLGLRNLVMYRGNMVKRKAALKVKIKMFQNLWNLDFKGDFGEKHLTYLNQAVQNLDASAGLVLNLLLLDLKNTLLILEQIEEQIEKKAKCERFQPWHDVLVGLKGVKTLTAMAIISAVGDISRFKHPRQLMAYFGLVPLENSSGESQRSGSITKRGNKEVRRVLIEAAANQFHKYVNWEKRKFMKRRKDLPPEIVQILDKAGNRLSKKASQLMKKGKHRNTVTVAVARELVGFIWDLMMQAKKQMNLKADSKKDIA